MSQPLAKSRLRLADTLGVIRSYDCWRLSQYLLLDDPQRGCIETLGHAKLLRFQDVGYFNRIYDFGSSNVNDLEYILDRYLTSMDKQYRYGVELIARHDFDLDSVSEQLLSFGFRPKEMVARLGLNLGSQLLPGEKSPCIPSGRLNFRHPDPGEFEAVLELYLSGFGAPREHHQQAMINMMQLFGHPELITWCAFDNERPVGLGMLYVQQPYALLVAGVTAPEYQNQGIHESLIQLRLAHAKSHGCSRIATWCESDGQSYKNLISQGFEVLRNEQVWKLPSQR
ncbi:MAG: GNAT family N-acetyltransferase [Rubripirellula sp.]|nr:GNAT family N-acetyltransferase [Rubripirellula sp.]MDF1843512.1 GNAT family N-acetyltransferase [Rubripirellula sp.]